MKQIFCILTSLLFVSMAQAQLSPGDLHKSHAHLEGLKNCISCHELGQKISSVKCLDCHQILAKRIENGKGLHALSEFKQCRNCHVEHQGRNFNLIYWKEAQDKFDHSKTGFRLEGKHEALKCRDCHKASHIRDLKKLTNRGKKAERTFLGLETDCLNCHRDEHRGQLKKDCLTCHNQQSWKPASGFDHNQTRFRLAGKHLKLDCQKCHRPVKDRHIDGDTSYLKFSGLRFTNCASCHKDVHLNKFGQDCRSCHNPAGWGQVNRNRFNHDATSFPLRGRHGALECSKCHKPGQPLTGLKYQYCADCHSDYHRGQFTARQREKDCNVCHSLEGFQPALFGITQHQETGFILTGAHLAVPCVACHPKTTSGVRATIRFFYPEKDCSTCHRDPHRGEHKQIAGADGCLHCHSVETWRSVKFDHARTKFPLELTHARQSCRKCHSAEKSGAGKGEVLFSGLDNRCESCHRDTHHGQFADKKQQTDCNRCHVPRDWLAEKFNHERHAAFKLEGAHQFVACEKCHRTEKNGQIKFIRYKPLNKECRDCHGTQKIGEDLRR